MPEKPEKSDSIASAADWFLTAVESIQAAPEEIAKTVTQLVQRHKTENGFKPEQRLPRRMRRAIAEKVRESYVGTAAFVGGAGLRQSRESPVVVRR
jgi:hypothetical protein